MHDAYVLSSGGVSVLAKIGLLTIPGELRNRIYEALLCCDPPVDNDSLPRLVPRSNSDNVSAPTHPSYWAGFQRQAYGLTQCCRQVRKELLPMYRENTKIRIDIWDLKNYLAKVIQPATTADPELLYGNISIDVTSPCRIDLQDLLLSHNCAPHLHLEFTHPERESDMMSILLDADRWPQFHAYISERTTQVVVDIDFDDFIAVCGSMDSDDDQEPWPYPLTQGCVLHVKREFAEEWMREPLVFEKYRAEMGDWEIALGLTGRKKIRCPFRPQVEIGTVAS
ncbi:hypothetical protein C7974DRAFT_396835 [Boeremia exigua]|uniref:uncharacterized protein n=1 Tax=Boeremia exigua TaxID=749465 RepID=UPI001E8E74E5|nr:uncharacterized protein C7974DRAFT_396835 [Boeremia exigua]KAH6625852.1 hypothetical protein C7974DRAFT_396835 [Boeremia exigua]